jgi:hypothetical protein
VWLENRGKRTFELSTGEISGSDLKKLRSQVEREREYLEVQWSVFMANNDWITLELNGSVVTITAYPKSHNKFTRTLDLQDQFPGAYKNEKSWSQKEIFVSVDEEHASLAVGPQREMDLRNHIRLDKILWED